MSKNNLTTILICNVVFLFLFNTKSVAQVPIKTFSVVKSVGISNVKQYEEAFEKANMESYRYQNIRCVIKFDSGIEIEMLSARELIAKGQKINLSDYKINDLPNWTQPVFHLNPNGTLSAIYSKANLKQNTISPK